MAVSPAEMAEELRKMKEEYEFKINETKDEIVKDFQATISDLNKKIEEMNLLYNKFSMEKQEKKKKVQFV